MAQFGTVRPKFYTAPGGFGGAMPSLILLRKMLATLDRARRENRPYWFALTVPSRAIATRVLSNRVSKLRSLGSGQRTQRQTLYPFE